MKYIFIFLIALIIRHDIKEINNKYFLIEEQKLVIEKQKKEIERVKIIIQVCKSKSGSFINNSVTCKSQ